MYLLHLDLVIGTAVLPLRSCIVTIAEGLSLMGTYCGDDLDGIYEGVNLPRRERRALGQFAAEMQRRRLVNEFEAALAEGDVSDSKVPFLFQGIC